MNAPPDWIISVRDFYTLVSKAELTYRSTFIYGLTASSLDGQPSSHKEEQNSDSEHHSVAVINASYKTQNEIPPLPFSFDMDIDQVACSASLFAHTAPKPSQFKEWAESHGIFKNTRIIVYSSDKTYTACRAAWLFSLFGYENVQVINGGSQEWSGFVPLDNDYAAPPAPASFSPSNSESFFDYTDFFLPLLANVSFVYKNITTKHYQVVDARSAERFAGTASLGPRGKEVSGSIPGSLNVPYLSLLGDTGKFLPPDALRAVFRDAGVDINRPILCTCGSGVTACVLFIALKLIGTLDVCVFDGSWQEWSSHEDLPIFRTQASA